MDNTNMCPFTIILCSLLLHIGVAVVGAFEESSSGKAPFHVAPMTGGTVSGLVSVPAAIVTGSPLSAIGSFGAGILISSVAGSWNRGDIIGRGILSGIAFILVALITISAWLADITFVFEILVLLSNSTINALSIFGLDCY